MPKIIPKTDTRLLNDWRYKVSSDNIKSNIPKIIDPIQAPKQLIQKNIREQIDRKYRLANPTIGDQVSDIGTRISSGLKTLGGSIVGDAIKAISPNAGNIVSKYTAGMISPTSDEDIVTGRLGTPMQKINLVSQGVTGAMLGELTGSAFSGAGKIISKKISPLKLLLDQEAALSRGNMVANKSGDFFNELQRSKGFQKRFEDYVGTGSVDDYASFSINDGPRTIDTNTNIYAYSPIKKNPIFSYKPKANKSFMANELKGTSGAFLPRTNEIGVAATDRFGAPLKDVDIYKTTSHELLHKYAKYNEGPSVLQDLPKNEYFTPSDTWEHRNQFMKFANKDFPWAMSPEEHIAELVGNRAVKRLDNNLNYTTEQANQFINNPRFRRLYNSNVLKGPGVERTAAIDFIKRFGAIIPSIGVGYQMVNRNK